MQLKKVVEYVKSRASASYFLSFMACLIDNGFMKIYDDDEKTKDELINYIMDGLKTSSSSYFFSSFSPAYIGIYMAKDILKRNGFKF